MSISIQDAYKHLKQYMKDKMFAGQLEKGNFHGELRVIFKDGRAVQINLIEECR